MCFPPGGPASELAGETYNTGHYVQTFQPVSFIFAMFIGTSDPYHLLPLSVTLTMAGGHMVSTNQKLLA